MISRPSDIAESLQEQAEAVVREPSPIEVHPLRASDMLLETALERRGYKPVHKPRIAKPWKWEKVRNLFWKLGYVPSPGQRAFHQSTARFKCLIGGARFGKTMPLPREALPTILTPGTLTWIVGPSYDLASREWDFLVADLEALGLLELATVKQMGRPGRIDFPWGSRVETRSADNPASLLGVEVNDMILSEATQLPERVMNRYLRARLGPRLGRLLIATTPFGFNWVRNIWERGVKQGEAIATGEADMATITYQESVRAWQFSVLENPYFDPAEYLAAQKELPPEEFAEQYDGRFTSMSGRIIPSFQKRTHVLPAEAMPDELHGMPVFRTIDFGFSNPSVCLWCVFDAHGIRYTDRDGNPQKAKPRTWWIVGEVYRKQMLTEQLAVEIKAHPWTVNHRVVCSIGDMADAQARATLARAGVPCAAEVSRIFEDEKVPIDKAWEAGIRTMRALFYQERVKVADCCVNTIRELQEATFADDARDRQEPGQDDHAMDAFRYLAHTMTPV